MSTIRKSFFSFFAFLFIVGWIGCARNSPQPVTETSGVVEVKEGMVSISGGVFRMGNDHSPRSSEAPAHDVSLKPFRMDEHEVTNGEFIDFVGSTNYITTAEKQGWSMVYNLDEEKWYRSEGADWRHPNGPESSIDGREDYPVVHVSWFDAEAYARWAKKRLPTEAQWEAAARAGLRDAEFPWGNEEVVREKYQANYRQLDDKPDADGFLKLAPVKSFSASRYGLYDMAGNVWEWCGDWYDANYYVQSPIDDPAGPKKGKERVIRGGSWVCPEKFFVGYTVYARSSRPPEYSSNNLGFRCVQ